MISVRREFITRYQGQSYNANFIFLCNYFLTVTVTACLSPILIINTCGAFPDANDVHACESHEVLAISFQNFFFILFLTIFFVLLTLTTGRRKNFFLMGPREFLVSP